MVYKNYTKNTLDTIVRYIFEFKGDKCIINNLQDILSLTLGELIEILQHLKIGNKSLIKLKVKWQQLKLKHHTIWTNLKILKYSKRQLIKLSLVLYSL